MSKSNDNGRVFEYLIAHNLIQKLGSNCIITESTKYQNNRDKEKPTKISSQQLIYFNNAIPLITDWIIQNFKYNNIEIDRIPDDAGKKGDVTDIRLTSGIKELNISCKNNSASIKHQRPGSTPTRFGLNKKEIEYILFSEKYKNINSIFFDLCKKNITNLEYYNQIDTQTKIDRLYKPVCILVSNFINQNCNKGQTYLDFLLGTVDYKQITLNKKEILIKSFENFPKSTTVTSSIDNRGNYILVNFHNFISLEIRLHSAGSEINKIGNLKFDTKIIEDKFQTEKIQIP